MNFGNLGVALGAGVDEWHKQQEESRKQTAEERAALQFQQQQEQYARQQKQQQAMDAVNAKYAGYREALKKGDYSFADGLIGEYNANQGAWADGLTVQGQSTPQGKVLNFVGQDGKVARSVPVNAQSLSQMLDDAHMTEMKYASPEGFQNAYYKDRTHGLDLRKVGAEETRAGAAKQQADTMEGYRQWQQSQPRLERNALGQTMAISPDGTKLIATHGPALNPYAHLGGGSGAGGKTDWVPMGEDSDGQVVFFNKKAVVDPRNPDSMFLRPDGKPVSDVRGLYRKLTGAAVDKPQPTIPKEAVTEFARSYFNADPKTQQMLKLQNPVLASLVTGGSTELKPGAMAGGKPPVAAVTAAPQSRPTTDPIAAFRTNRGVDLTSNDPLVQLQAMQEMGQLVADRDRRLGLPPRLTGKEWYYTPQTNK